jgi:hypothetical protein
MKPPEVERHIARENAGEDEADTGNGRRRNSVLHQGHGGGE